MLPKSLFFRETQEEVAGLMLELQSKEPLASLTRVPEPFESQIIRPAIVVEC